MNSRVLSVAASLLMSLTAACANETASDEAEPQETAATTPPAADEAVHPQAISTGTSAGDSTSLFKVCVDKCTDWCVIRNGHKICGTSCICTFQ